MGLAGEREIRVFLFTFTRSSPSSLYYGFPCRLSLSSFFVSLIFFPRRVPISPQLYASSPCARNENLFTLSDFSAALLRVCVFCYVVVVVFDESSKRLKRLPRVLVVMGMCNGGRIGIVRVYCGYREGCFFRGSEMRIMM